MIPKNAERDRIVDKIADYLCDLEEITPDDVRYALDLYEECAKGFEQERCEFDVDYCFEMDL